MSALLKRVESVFSILESNASIVQGIQVEVVYVRLKT